VARQLEQEGTISGFQTRLVPLRTAQPFGLKIRRALCGTATGRALYYEGALKDVTERQQAEAERERLLNQMQVRAAELATVAEISHRITTILDI